MYTIKTYAAQDIAIASSLVPAMVPKTSADQKLFGSFREPNKAAIRLTPDNIVITPAIRDVSDC